MSWGLGDSVVGGSGERCGKGNFCCFPDWRLLIERVVETATAPAPAPAPKKLTGVTCVEKKNVVRVDHRLEVFAYRLVTTEVVAELTTN